MSLPSFRGSLSPPPADFVLYVEGPRDREILRRWAQRVSQPISRAIERSSVILGGCQPARAAQHFRSQEPGTRGICVLDRDGRDQEVASLPDEEGLEFFQWQRRHIESYLLVPEVLQRILGITAGDSRGRRLLRDLLPEPGDEILFQQLDAKRLLDQRGPLARHFGRPLQAGRIARAMRESELHPDILDLLARVESALGIGPSTPQVIARRL